MNKVFLCGHVGQPPEVKTFEGGNKVALFSLATNESYRNKDGEKVTQTEWHKVQAWGKLAGIVEQYVDKGSNLLIEGKIKTRSYDKDGEKRYITEIVATTIKMLGESKGENNSPGHEHVPSKDHSAVAPGDEPLDDDDGLPF